MDDLRVSFPAMDTTDGRTSLDARSFRRAALALATGNLPRHTTAEPVYIVAPERRRWFAPVLLGVIALAAAAAVLVWLL